MSKQASGRIRLSAEEIYAQELSALVAGRQICSSRELASFA